MSGTIPGFSDVPLYAIKFSGGEAGPVDMISTTTNAADWTVNPQATGSYDVTYGATDFGAAFAYVPMVSAASALGGAYAIITTTGTNSLSVATFDSTGAPVDVAFVQLYVIPATVI